MRRIMLAIPLLAVLLPASGCTKNKLYGLPKYAKPLPWVFNQVPKDMSPTYQYGWKHGCESGLATMSNSLYHSAYRFKIDPAMRHHALVTDPAGRRSDAPEYYKAWKDAYEYCRAYGYGRVREADERTTLPNEVPTTLANLMGAHNWNKRGLLNMWGPGTDSQLLENVGPIAGNSEFGDDGHMNWDFSDGYNAITGSMADVMNWDFTKD